MKFVYYASVLVTFCMSMVLAGCGAGGTSPETKNALHESTACISCHQDSNWQTPGTGKNVVAEWTLSTHNTNNGAGCGDCHGYGSNHPASCIKCHATGAAFNPIINPDAAGKCATCHDSTKGYSTDRNYNGKSLNTLTEHFSTPTLKAYTSGSFKARFITKNYEQSCRSCHNPHDTGTHMEKFRQWARSGKGNVSANPWASRDFRLSGTALPATPATTFGSECVRCHTATGFITYLKNKTIAPFGSTSKVEGREVLACNACHDDGSGYAYGYKLRSVGQVTAYYNVSTTQAGPVRYRIRATETYDNIGKSNLCLTCHVGREIGEIIKTAAAQGLNFANTGFISSHYMTAGASIFQASGYEFNLRSYPQGQGTPGSFPHLHRTVGVNNQNGTGSDGPCITCHLKPGRHTFLPLNLTEVATTDSLWLRQITGIVSPECAKCHNGTTAPAQSVASLNTSKTGFFATLEILRTIMATRNLHYRSGSIFNAATGTTRVTNWTKAPASGADVMGAAFNYVLLNFDYGAYTHNIFYSKRLLYDSIDLLDDLTLNYSTCSTIGPVNTAPFNYLCVNGASNSLTERP